MSLGGAFGQPYFFYRGICLLHSGRKPTPPITPVTTTQLSGCHRRRNAHHHHHQWRCFPLKKKKRKIRPFFVSHRVHPPSVVVVFHSHSYSNKNIPSPSFPSFFLSFFAAVGIRHL